MLLDTKTTLAYYVLTSLTLAVLLLVAFRGRFTPSLRLWLACLSCQALGWFFISLQNLPLVCFVCLILARQLVSPVGPQARRGAWSVAPPLMDNPNGCLGL